MIEVFYAVTAYMPDDEGPLSVSAYKIFTEKDMVVLEKIALKGSSNIPIGARLSNGYTLAVQYRGGIQRYDEARGSRRVDDVNTKHFGGGTASIVGLFLEKSDALKCFNSPNVRHWDERFISESVKVIEAIGDSVETIINLDATLARGLKENKLQQYLSEYNLAYNE